jgi:hypothetical protein
VSSEKTVWKYGIKIVIRQDLVKPDSYLPP